MDNLDTAIQAIEPRYMTNSGHGHAWTRPDGVRARCGGTRLCLKCSRDFAAVSTARQIVSERVA